MLFKRTRHLTSLTWCTRWINTARWQIIVYKWDGHKSKGHNPIEVVFLLYIVGVFTKALRGRRKCLRVWVTTNAIRQGIFQRTGRPDPLSISDAFHFIIYLLIAINPSCKANSVCPDKDLLSAASDLSLDSSSERTLDIKTNKTEFPVF